MLVNPTLTAEEFKNIHNALCDLDMLAQSLEDVLKPEKFVRLQKAKTAIREAMKRAYEEDNRLFTERSKYFEESREELKCSSIWSIYEVENLYDQHPFQGAEVLIYKDHWGDKPVSLPLVGDGWRLDRWVDLWFIADRLITASGDEHHVFIECFTLKNGNELYLSTGS